ncbi:amino acid adenylation domain-containing protein [Paenibacillus forsythiae]|uniref:Amino acid adenylation domain-containing protein n=1 Tax=Paenibacillus forsythiae TaxID=365616 RepID=A0ABU3H2L9_9BACL|nr:non-ribosomal peptide synthetase [Paenibacillus forsythiae]MDT3424985.1 amino acid adenylation domain-containing protein [Paenibacillus forsythiae]
MSKMYVDRLEAGASTKERIIQTVSGVTGHRTEDIDPEMFLEDDLGLDSIKMISLMNEMMQLIPEEQLDEFNAAHPVGSLLVIQTVRELVEIFEKWEASRRPAGDLANDTLAASASSPAEDLHAQLKVAVCELISEIAGHSIEDLHADMNLESDLGLDSIKMISLMNGMLKLLPAEQAEDFTCKHSFASLLTLETIGDIVELFADWRKHSGVGSEPGLDTGGPVVAEISENDPEFLEMIHTQYLFLVTYLSVANLSISSGVKVKGELNIGSLRESWRELVYRHPILRAVFTVDPGTSSLKGYRLKLLKEIVLPEISVEDIRHLGAQEQQQVISRRFEDALNHKFDITKWPLHTFSVIRTADDEYELILDINHLISDGLGNQQLLKEFLTIYGARSQKKMAGLGPALHAQEYNRIAAGLNTWNAPEEVQALDDYVRQQGRGTYFFNPYKSSKAFSAAHSPGAVIRTRKYWLDEQTTALLINRTKAWRTSLFVLLVSAYIKTIKQQGEEQSQIILNLPTSGKLYPNQDATDVLGAFAQNLALTFSCDDAGEAWESLIGRTREVINSKLSSGIDRAQTYRAAHYAKETIPLQDGGMPAAAASMIRSTLKSNLYLSFVGNTSIDKRYGNYEIHDYEAYTGTNPGTIDNLVEIFQGRLMLTSNYDSSFFDGEYMEAHMRRFIENIKSLAAVEVKAAEPFSGLPRTHNGEMEETLRRIAEEIGARRLGAEDLSMDLEAELGLDSLQRIRLIARLGGIFKGIDKESLLGCRTLNEIIAVMADGSGIQPSLSEHAGGADIPYLKISRQCKITPDAVAVLDGERSLTYRDLDSLSNRLAHYLRSQGVKSQSLVGIMTLPGPLLLVGILGILKAGAAYVPLDPVYPHERIKYIVGHARLQFLLTEQSLKEQADLIVSESPSVRTLVWLDETEDSSQWRSCSDQEPDVESSPHDVMVVLYTSGSTGNPKGVLLNHRGYMNRLEWHQETFRMQPGERVAQKTSCCFDISVWELLWPLMYGGTVCPARPEVVKNPWSLARWMIDTGINVMHFVPSLFGEFVHSLEDEGYAFPKLRWLIFSGEALPLSPVQKWLDRHGRSTGLANLYGPTEASIDVTCHIISERPGAGGELGIPIGKPIKGAFIKNLDEQMREVPEGEIGQLWIGGIQLAKGYLHDPEKTREAFHPNPFPEIPGEFIYRTGDLTLKRADGSYEYHGRIDNQVKLRGFRVELGEIEAVLDAHPGIDEAAVIVVEPVPGQQTLLACLSGKVTDDKEIKDFIGRKLPYYMIPHRLEWLPRLPKNPNGKLDRKALRDQFGGPGSQAESSDRQRLHGEDTLPLAPAQSWLMHYFEYPHCWAGYTRFVYKQPLDLQRFKQAVAMLNGRHDVLRSVLVQKDSGWEQRFLSEGMDSNVDFYDGRHMEEAQRNQEIQAILTEVIEGLKVDQWPLWRIVVTRISESSYDIAAVGHHLISDVITNQLLVQEIWQIYAGLESGEAGVQLPKPNPYADFVRAVQEEKSIHAKAYADYWTSQFTAESVCKLPADFFKGPNDEQSARVVRFEFDKANTSSILNKAKPHFGSNVYPILLAPLYRMLGNLFQRPEVIVSHRMHGRELGGKQSFMQTPGSFAVNFPLGIHVEENSGWQELVRGIRQGLEEVPLGGVSYDLVSGSLPLYMYPDVKLTPIRANYLGNRDMPKLPGFEFSKEGMDRRFALPGQKRISVIEFFFSIEEGKLVVEIEYSANLHDAATINRLAEQYTENMLKLLRSVESPESPRGVREGQLSQKVAIVTGGSKGIGRSIALSLAREGADIVLVSRSVQPLLETAEEIRGLGAEVLAISADVSDAPSVQQAVDQAVERFGHIDILVNSAGITGMAAMADMSPEAWHKIIQVNLLGTYHFCYAAIPHLVKRKQGKIINIGSDSSFIGYPMMSAYAASKHGVLGLTRALSEELKNSNIQVNALCPALVNTDMAPAAFRGRAIPPSGVADSAVFLASSASDYITGEALQIYGKQDMNWFGAQQMQMLQAVMRKQPSS